MNNGNEEKREIEKKAKQGQMQSQRGKNGGRAQIEKIYS